MKNELCASKRLGETPRHLQGDFKGGANRPGEPGFFQRADSLVTLVWSTNERAAELPAVELSVVMPKHNRAQVLEHVLTTLTKEMAALDRPAASSKTRFL